MTKRYSPGIKLAAVILLGVAWLIFAFWAAVAHSVDWIDDHRGVIATFTVAQYAHVRAGPEIPLEIDDYSYCRPQVYFSTLTNSKWLTDWARKIVPAFFYEKVSFVTKYPAAVGFWPQEKDKSFHTAGWAQPYWDSAWLNERYLSDGRWNDARAALGTLVHELVHLQGGAYLGTNPEEFEPRTQAATLEVLAGMCLYSEDLACRAFWLDVEGYARSAFRLAMHDKGYVATHKFIINLLWRTAEDNRITEKAGRYWAEDEEQREYIIRAYVIRPWDIVLLGVLDDVPQKTGLGARAADGGFSALEMPFDDTQVLFKHILWFLDWARRG